MHAVIQQAKPLQGELALPPDKAICHRAVLLAALAKGSTTIHPWPSAEDCQRTLALVERLGVRGQRSANALTIEGRGLRGLQAPSDPLLCGESGTTLRLAAGLLAGQPFASQLAASPSLSRRPMRRIVEPLTRMGARFEGTASVGSSEVYPPLAVHGRFPLEPIRYELPVASAQVKSAVLLAGLFARGRTTVVERHPTRDHTERMMRHFGLALSQEGPEISVEPGEPVSPGAVHIPGDASSAAFFLVAASCVAGSRVTLRQVSLNPTRTGLLDVLRRMGAACSVTATESPWEPRGTVTIEARPLRAIVLEAAEAPSVIDELPILMVAAACAQGRSRLQGVGELRVKETDRLRSMAEGLTKMGVRVSVPSPETVEIDGGTLSGAEVESAGDHRTAMSLAVAGLVARGRTTIRGAECVAKSFPEFFDLLGRLAGSPTVKTVDKT
ncbi:MAG: 3-phosphoshikimate 1-carboxyvinyltransferase [Candidatus Omnitrophica bacterium]|nr:3-phosphoshikimate 1-carboxyvinyltransferase [Candidatus Omnitrophota bacterium]